MESLHAIWRKNREFFDILGSRKKVATILFCRPYRVTKITKINISAFPFFSGYEGFLGFLCRVGFGKDMLPRFREFLFNQKISVSETIPDKQDTQKIQNNRNKRKTTEKFTVRISEAKTRTTTNELKRIWKSSKNLNQFYSYVLRFFLWPKSFTPNFQKLLKYRV